MKTIIIVVGVYLLGAASAETDQSEESTLNNQPIGDEESVEKGAKTPEVVLQLKYDEGELKRIYLTQFRKLERSWKPSVSDRSNLCADLCHAGLGGKVCGSSCLQLIPMGLHSVLAEGNHTEGSTEESYGQPRVAVCPALCRNFMGKPLCQCPSQEEETISVNWTQVCNAFCADGYVLGGCPVCEASPLLPATQLMANRALSSVQGWAAWCDVQCRQGHGGAACNCDRTPF